MKKLNKLLNDISKYPISFHNMEKSLKGTILCNGVFMNKPDNTIFFVDYRFDGFIKSETTWKIDINMDFPNIERKFKYRGEKQKIIKRRVYKLLLIISNVEEVLQKINV